MTRLAAPPAGRLPRGLASRLVASGQRRRSAAQAAVLRRLQGLVPPVVDAVLDQIDLTELVVRRVDLDRVAARLDLIGLAEYIVDGIDLPRIIRESTGSVASEGIRGIRMQSIEADQAVARFVDRLLLRREPRRSYSGAGRFLGNGAGR
jgi:hypothetical protein